MCARRALRGTGFAPVGGKSTTSASTVAVGASNRSRGPRRLPGASRRRGRRGRKVGAPAAGRGGARGGGARRRGRTGRGRWSRCPRARPASSTVPGVGVLLAGGWALCCSLQLEPPEAYTRVRFRFRCWDPQSQPAGGRRVAARTPLGHPRTPPRPGVRRLRAPPRPRQRNSPSPSEGSKPSGGGVGDGAGKGGGRGRRGLCRSAVGHPPRDAPRHRRAVAERRKK